MYIFKVSGPDGLNAIVLKVSNSEISPKLALTSNESLARAVPDDR